MKKITFSSLVLCLFFKPIIVYIRFVFSFFFFFFSCLFTFFFDNFASVRTMAEMEWQTFVAAVNYELRTKDVLNDIKLNRESEIEVMSRLMAVPDVR